MQSATEGQPPDQQYLVAMPSGDELDNFAPATSEGGPSTDAASASPFGGAAQARAVLHAMPPQAGELVQYSQTELMQIFCERTQEAAEKLPASAAAAQDAMRGKAGGAAVSASGVGVQGGQGAQPREAAAASTRARCGTDCCDGVMFVAEGDVRTRVASAVLSCHCFDLYGCCCYVAVVGRLGRRRGSEGHCTVVVDNCAMISDTVILSPIRTRACASRRKQAQTAVS